MRFSINYIFCLEDHKVVEKDKGGEISFAVRPSGDAEAEDTEQQEHPEGGGLGPVQNRVMCQKSNCKSFHLFHFIIIGANIVSMWQQSIRVSL